MITRPIWLHDIVDVRGELPEVARALYALFTAEFLDKPCLLQACEVRFNRLKECWAGGLFEGAFVHLVTRDDHKHVDRQFDPERASRLPWCAPTIRNNSDPCVLMWDYEEGRRRVRTYLWLREYDYAVILEKRKGHYYLITAYYVDGDSNRRSLRRKYEQRIV